MIKTILFDLDGTLVPLSQSDFANYYLKSLMCVHDKLNVSKEILKKAILCGLASMSVNDGSKTNEEAFWEKYTQITGQSRISSEPVFKKYYVNEFNTVKEAVRPTELSRKIIDYLKDKGYKLVLATNPIFPIEAVKTRLNWVGLKAEDFEHITTYDNSSFCKPNPNFYSEILKKLGLSANECFMVGNNVTEDMAAEKAGIKTYLITDVLENDDNLDYSGYQNSSLQQFYLFLQKEF